jgi:hypothetical protein
MPPEGKKRGSEPVKADLPAGPFSVWLDRIRRAQKTKAGADVPCGECRGCCTSSYFIHIDPGEKDALAAIPKRLRFPAPGLPKGHVLLGYDEKGHCPMFKDNACSIYAHRPQTCRDYDCRVFAAAGLAADADKPRIAGQAVRWKFAFPKDADRKRFAAVRAAAAFLSENAALFPAGFVPGNPAQLAMLALKVCDAFADGSVGAGAAGKRKLAAAAVSAYARFQEDDA